MVDSSEVAQRDDDAVGRFVERFALTFAAAGFPRMPARVFVTLLIADEGGRTAAELADSLQVSPAAVSSAVRYLIQVGLVSKEREVGSRRDHYQVYDDVWYEAIMREDALFGSWERSLTEGVDVIGAQTPAGKRLDQTRRFFSFMREEFPRLLGRWREVNAAAEQTDTEPAATGQVEQVGPGVQAKR